LLESIAMRQVNTYFVSRDIDTLLTSARLEASSTIRDAIVAELEANPIGLEVVQVAVTNLHPPQLQEVAAKFQEQINAEIERENLIQMARKDAVTTLSRVAGSQEKAMGIADAIEALDELLTEVDERSPIDPTTGTRELSEDDQAMILALTAAVEQLLGEAGGEAAQAIFQARADRWRWAVAEQSRAAQFSSELLAYRQAPEYYKARSYLDTLAAGAADRRKIVVDTHDGEDPNVRIELNPVQALEDILKGGGG